jgi:ankyrin repeat protein
LGETVKPLAMILRRFLWLLMALFLAVNSSWAQQKPQKPKAKAKIPVWLANELVYGLCDSARKGNTARMEELLKRGAQINGRDMRKARSGGFCQGMLPIFAAIEGRSLPAVKLISRGADLKTTVYEDDLENVIDKGNFNEISPIEDAARLDELEIFQCLQNTGAPSLDDYWTNDYDDTLELQQVYRMASMYNACKVLAWLFDSEPDTKDVLTPKEKALRVRETSYLLQSAAKYENKEMVDLLIGLGASSKACGQALNVATKEAKFAMALQLAPHSTLQKDEDGFSPLAYTVEKLWSPYKSVEEIPELKGARLSPESRKKYEDELRDHAANKKLGPLLIAALIDRGGDPNEVFPAGYTPLLLAVERGNAPYVATLLEKGADPNQAPAPFPSPLRLLAKVGYLVHTNWQLALLSDGAPNQFQTERSLAEEVDVEVAKLLIARGADPRSGDNQYALGEAILNGNVALSKLLLKSGADANHRFVARPYFKSPDRRGPMSKKAESKMEEDGRNLRLSETPSSLQQTPLQMAARGGLTATVDDLLKAGADAKAKDSWKQNALHHLALGGNNHRIFEFETSISTQGRFMMMIPISATRTKIMNDWAIQNDGAIAKQLLDAGCSPDAPDRKGQTPRQLAASHSNMEVLNMLLAASKTPVSTKDLFEVIEHGRRQSRALPALATLEYAYLTHERGRPDSSSDESSKHKWEENPESMHAQTLKQRNQLLKIWGEADAQVITRLLRAGAKVNERNGAGLTPLLSAARLGQTEVVRTLIKAGADVRAKNRGGETMLTQIQKYGPASFKKLPLNEVRYSERETWMRPEAIRDRTSRIRHILATEDAAIAKMLRQAGAH